MISLHSRGKFDNRPIFNAYVRVIHAKNVVTMSHRTKNKLSDLWVGVLVVGAFL